MKHECWSEELVKKFLTDEEFVKNHINARDIMGRPAIMSLTLNNKNYELIKRVLDLGAKINCTNKDTDTVLMFNHFTSEEILELFLSYGADPNLKNKYGMTALMFYVQFPTKIKILLNHGADVNRRDLEDKTALMYALEKSCIDSADLLVDAGSDLFAVDNDGRSVLDYMNTLVDKMTTERKIHLEKACALRNKIIDLQNTRNGESPVEMS
jgi:ankyrin repeat protein